MLVGKKERRRRRMGGWDKKGRWWGMGDELAGVPRLMQSSSSRNS